jgi:hypothetical protein
MLAITVQLLFGGGSVKVRVVYDRKGTILSADWVLEGSSVAEFDLPDYAFVGMVDEASEIEVEEEELLSRQPLPEGIDVEGFRSSLREEIAGRRAARRFRVLNRLRVDVDSMSLQPIEEGSRE